MLKNLAFVVVALIAGVLLFAATRPDSFRVERRALIQASPAKIFPLISDLHAFPTWSPWEKRDPAMKRTHTGPASGPGATYAWDGNKEVGSGSMQITEAVAPERVTMKLDFLTPFEAHNLVDFTLAPKDGGATEVVWAMHGPSPFVSKLMGLVFNMDKMVGRDFEEGLANMKALAEK
jgi:uncharacterized protein YndB with AHSA1/START domain